MDSRIRAAERSGDQLRELIERSRLPGREGWLADRRRRLLLTGQAPQVEPQPWFDEVIKEQREMWRAVGLSCEPADKDAAERVIARFYRRLRKEPPRFLWFSSPLSANAAPNVMQGRLGDQFGDQLWSQLLSQLRLQLVSQLRSQLWSQLGSQLWSQLWSQLGSQLGSQLRNQLGSQLRSQLGSQLESQLESPIYTFFWGAWDAYWVGYYAAVRELGVCYDADNDALLIEWEALTRSCLWWWPYEGTCVISDRPREIVFEGGKLKRCLFEDGWGING